MEQMQKLNEPMDSDTAQMQDLTEALRKEISTFKMLMLEMKASYQRRVRVAFEAGYEAGLVGDNALEAFYRFNNGSN